MSNYKCTECGGKLIEEGVSQIYFCENCKAMVYRDEDTKEFKLIKGRRIK